MTAPALPDDLLTADEAGALLRVSVRSLRAWRARAQGPSYITLAGGQIRYSAADVRSWLDEQRQPTRSVAS